MGQALAPTAPDRVFFLFGQALGHGCLSQNRPVRTIADRCCDDHLNPPLPFLTEIDNLQAKWAAHLPYWQATELLQEVLPPDKGISTSSTRRRVLAVGKAIDEQIERNPVETPKPTEGSQVRESIGVASVSVDSAWLKFSSSRRSRQAARNLAELLSPWVKRLMQARHVNIVAGSTFYIDKNNRTLMSYGARHRKGLPISGNIAESAVNHVVSHRMARKQQTRWTDEGAHDLAQVRVAVLNAELPAHRIASLAKARAANSTYLHDVA